jgi:hypothetical protein
MGPISEWPQLSIAASHWVEAAEAGEVVGEAALRALRSIRRFRVKVRGQCMEPDWRDRDLVEFRLLDNGEDYEVGQDYYVQTDEGGTFKRCYEVAPDTIVIGCVTTDERWTVELARVTRAAIALHVILDRRKVRNGN